MTADPARARVLATVSRTWFRTDDIMSSYRFGVAFGALRGIATDLCPDRPPSGEGPILVHGAEPNGDQRLADLWESWGMPTEAHPADWKTCGPECPPSRSCRRRGRFGEYCVTAGYRRNAEMVALGAVRGLALIRDRSGGATDCADRMDAAGIPVRRIPFPARTEEP